MNVKAIWSSLQRVLYCVVLACGCAAGPAQAQSAAELLAEPRPADRARMEEVFRSINLPYTRDVVDRFLAYLRSAMVQEFLGGIASGGRLGADWRPGNTHYDKVKQVVERALAKSEEQEPLFDFSARTFAAELKLNWTEDDVDFMQRTLKTQLGVKTMEWLDAFVAPMLIRELGSSPQFKGFMTEQVREIGRLADRRMVEVTPDMMQAAKGNEATLERAKRLIATFNREAGRVMGERIGARAAARVVLLVRDLSPQIAPILQEYRRSQTGVPSTT